MLSSEDVGSFQLPFDPGRIYEEGGVIDDSYPEFEERPEQIEMASLIADALRSGENLIVEAGTGTGKSLAYLIPLIRFAQETDEPVLVTTNTINLQEQLIQNDLPLIREATGWDFTVGLAKGRSNYICKKRLRSALSKGSQLFARQDKQKELNRLMDWVDETNDGSLSDLPWDVDGEVWNRVNAQRGMCHCHESSFQEHCFFRESREQIQQADVIVANHYFFMEDVALRKQANTGVLPDYGAVVVDEAHNLETVARRSFGLDISFLQCKYLVRDLYQPDDRSGTLVALDASSTDPVQDAINRVTRFNEMAEAFFSSVRDWHDQRGSEEQTIRVEEESFVRDTVTSALEMLHDELRTIISEVSLSDEEEKELNSISQRTNDLRLGLKQFINQDLDGHVYWVERSDYRKNVTLRSSRVDPSPVMRDELFEQIHSSILTSATLATGDDRPFEFIRERLGASNALGKELGHPFDYASQATLHIPNDMPHPGREERAYIEGLSEYAKTYISETQGNAFLLFTSYRMMNQAVEELESWLDDRGMLVLVQGRSKSRKQMIRSFKGDRPAVIFGVSSFWEGVDVPGNDLTNVIITKLPFPNPSNPIVEAFQEHLEEQGDNPFSSFFIPEAILRLRQGVGRLIRSRSDTGQIAILDSRILNNTYGPDFMEALPDMELTIDEELGHPSGQR